MATTEAETYIGKSVPRKEDAKLLTGQSKFIDDLTMTGMVWASIVRSPYAHARITRVDVTAAREAEGVVAVFSGADLADDWAATLPCVWLVTEDTKQPMHRPLATDKVRYQGDGVAIVIAESRALAKDAAELVEVDYEELPAVIDPEEALADGAPILHDDLGTNHCFTWKLEGGDVEGVFGNAPVTVKERYRQQRLIPNAIEPRGVIATYEPSTDEYTLWSATQIPHILRFWLAIVLGVPESRLRVIAPDVGGGFGSKLNVYAEEALALALAKRIGRPVKWTEERSEGYLATIHGRDQWQEMEYAADEDGKIRGVRAKLVVGLGAYLQLVTAGTPILGGWVYGGPYDVEAYSLEVVGAFTSATPTDAYRGAGRPEATFLIERTIDALARKLEMDPAELRRKNFITEFPYTLASGLTIDSGDFVGALDRALEMVGYEELRAEQAERRSKRRQEGARDRLLDLHRDVRPGAVADPRRHPLRGRRLGRGHGALPSDRKRRGLHRHLAARAGTRDHVLADRRGAARRPHRPGGGRPRRHHHDAARPRHVREPEPRRRRHRALQRGREGDRQGP